MGCPPRPGAGYPSLPPLQHRDPAFFQRRFTRSRASARLPWRWPISFVRDREPRGPCPQAADAGWNCCSSVEPFRADSELNDPAMTWFTVSK